MLIGVLCSGDSGSRGKASSCLHLAINPFERPTIAGAPSMVIDTNFHTRSWVYSMKFFKDWKMSFPHGRSFMSSNVNSSSFALISVFTIRIKMHSWAVSLVSVDFSNCSEKHLQSAMSFRSCCVKSSAITSQCCVTVLLDSWRALIDDNISS